MNKLSTRAQILSGAMFIGSLALATAAIAQSTAVANNSGVIEVDRASGAITVGAIPTADSPPIIVQVPSEEPVAVATGVPVAENDVATTRDDLIAILNDVTADADVMPEAVAVEPTALGNSLAKTIVETEPAGMKANALAATEIAAATGAEAIAQVSTELDVTEVVAVQPSATVADDTPLYSQMLISASDDQAALIAAISGAISDPSLGFSDDERAALAGLYAERGNAPIFLQDASGLQISTRTLADASRHGLPAERYDVGAIANINLVTPSINDKARFDVALAARVARYGFDQERGLVKPRSLGDEFDFEPIGRSHSALLADYIAQADKQTYFENVLPQDPAYQMMVGELARLRALDGDGLTVAKVPEGETLRRGDVSSRVAMLRERLDAMGYPSVYAQLSGTTMSVSDAIMTDVAGDANATVLAQGQITSNVNPNEFDEALEFAVRAYQTAAGIDVDGVVGPSTLANINAGSEDKIRSLLVGLERHRWGPQNRDGRQIYVNIANFMAEIRDENAKVFETRVVVGKNKDGWRTPEFNDEMTHMIINPKWYVPESISVKEYLPKIQADPNYLARNGIVMKIRATGQVVSPTQINMNQFTVNDFPFLLVQSEGDGNALGDVKFMFPNKHNIYLHDTPSKDLFSRAVRAFSHGCVRVGDPVDFAKKLLEPQVSDPEASYRSYLNTGTEQQINLTTPLPIHLTYFTAYPNSAGGISYASDAYGRDQLLQRALEPMGVTF